MSSDIQLDAKTYQAIAHHCEDGDRLTEADQLDEALAAYRRAWDLLPDPQRAWEVATWIKVAIADVHFFAARFDEAIAELDYALTCPGGLSNPYIALRMGQALWELGQADEARECLRDALAAAGAEIFDGEDGKYLALAREGGK
ncbi:MAG: tetratricopeptide repeat protein [Paludibacterium sp.]|uniref:tetratricopeptide repeat protein n=1 Tax=Paludibacterium sp. TaxID=1917523 RepID=UPI0025CDA3FE|nr:tetratricopeptide repeat protein [Paludibacterium sp.]MBV8049273.1 tetratricopeptide repeat protein [Paludibacterium sp.]MBV8649053.1 tetratricopeptide repeat protein [Paludibacterium sp.]